MWRYEQVTLTGTCRKNIKTNGELSLAGYKGSRPKVWSLQRQ